MEIICLEFNTDTENKKIKSFVKAIEKRSKEIKKIQNYIKVSINNAPAVGQQFRDNFVTLH